MNFNIRLQPDFAARLKTAAESLDVLACDLVREGASRVITEYEKTGGVRLTNKCKPSSKTEASSKAENK